MPKKKKKKRTQKAYLNNVLTGEGRILAQGITHASTPETLLIRRAWNLPHGPLYRKALRY